MKKTASVKKVKVIKHKDAPKTTNQLLERIHAADTDTEYGEGYLRGVIDTGVIKNKQAKSIAIGWTAVGLLVGYGIGVMVSKD